MKWKFFCLISIVLLVEANNRLKYIRNLQWRINGFHCRLFAPTWLFQKEGFIENVLCNFIQSLFHFNKSQRYIGILKMGAKFLASKDLKETL